MPHFTEHPIADDPRSLRRLRAMLRGPGSRDRRPPTRAERFGVPPVEAADRGGPERALVQVGGRSRPG